MRQMNVELLFLSVYFLKSKIIITESMKKIERILTKIIGFILGIFFY